MSTFCTDRSTQACVEELFGSPKEIAARLCAYFTSQIDPDERCAGIELWLRFANEDCNYRLGQVSNNENTMFYPIVKHDLQDKHSLLCEDGELAARLFDHQRGNTQDNLQGFIVSSGGAGVMTFRRVTQVDLSVVLPFKTVDHKHCDDHKRADETNSLQFNLVPEAKNCFARYNHEITAEIEAQVKSSDAYLYGTHVWLVLGQECYLLGVVGMDDRMSRFAQHPSAIRGTCEIYNVQKLYVSLESSINKYLTNYLLFTNNPDLPNYTKIGDRSLQNSNTFLERICYRSVPEFNVAVDHALIKMGVDDPQIILRKIIREMPNRKYQSINRKDLWVCFPRNCPHHSCRDTEYDDEPTVNSVAYLVGGFVPNKYRHLIRCGCQQLIIEQSENFSAKLATRIKAASQGVELLVSDSLTDDNIVRANITFLERYSIQDYGLDVLFVGKADADHDNDDATDNADDADNADNDNDDNADDADHDNDADAADHNANNNANADNLLSATTITDEQAAVETIKNLDSVSIERPEKKVIFAALVHQAFALIWRSYRLAKIVSAVEKRCLVDPVVDRTSMIWVKTPLGWYEIGAWAAKFTDADMDMSVDFPVAGREKSQQPSLAELRTVLCADECTVFLDVRGDGSLENLGNF